MGDTGPADEPFGGMGFLGDIARMLQGSGAGGWDTARQVAVQLATGGQAEANPDPIERIKLEELGRVADLRVADATGLSTSTTGRVVSIVPVTRSEWARRTIDAWRPLFERLSAGGLFLPPDAGADEPEGDPMAAMLSGLFSMLGPMLMGMVAGSSVGHLATRALGQYDLPLPRPTSDELVVVGANVSAFADEWSLPGDDLLLWLCLSEVATHAVLGVPHVRERLESLVLEYVGGFRSDPGALEEQLGGLDPSDPTALQRVLGDPVALLGAVQSDEQRALRPRLEALLAVLTGYVDHVVESVGSTLIGSYGMLTEALHRRRVEAGEGDKLVERLFGVNLDRPAYERGQAFVAGVLERGGPDALARLWTSPRELPTPPEVDAPGLWLARIDLPD